MLRLRFCVAASLLLFSGTTGCHDAGVSPEPHEDTAIATDALTLEQESETAVLDGARTEFGAPLRGLPPDLVERFEDGVEDFEEVETAEDGLGPVFNDLSCIACHDQAASVGAGHCRNALGRVNGDGSFDPLSQYGGSLIQAQGVAYATQTGGGSARGGHVVAAARRPRCSGSACSTRFRIDCCAPSPIRSTTTATASRGV